MATQAYLQNARCCLDCQPTSTTASHAVNLGLLYPPLKNKEKASGTPAGSYAGVTPRRERHPGGGAPPWRENACGDPNPLLHPLWSVVSSSNIFLAPCTRTTSKGNRNVDLVNLHSAVLEPPWPFHPDSTNRHALAARGRRIPCCGVAGDQQRNSSPAAQQRPPCDRPHRVAEPQGSPASDGARERGRPPVTPGNSTARLKPWSSARHALQVDSLDNAGRQLKAVRGGLRGG